MIVPIRTFASFLDLSACCQSARLKSQADSEVFIRAFSLFYVLFIIAWSDFALLLTFSSQKFRPGYSPHYESLIHLRHFDLIGLSQKPLMLRFVFRLSGQAF